MAGGLDAPSLLKTALAQGTLQVIGAHTLDEYHRFVETDKALERERQCQCLCQCLLRARKRRVSLGRKAVVTGAEAPVCP